MGEAFEAPPLLVLVGGERKRGTQKEKNGGGDQAQPMSEVTLEARLGGEPGPETTKHQFGSSFL